MDISAQAATAVGPWIVQAKVHQVDDQSEKEALLKGKAVPSMDHFMKGYIKYYLEVPCTVQSSEMSPAPLVFTSSFRKDTRPAAWKCTDDKIQDTLPLLGVSEIPGHVAEGSQMALVRVTLTRKS